MGHLFLMSNELSSYKNSTFVYGKHNYMVCRRKQFLSYIDLWMIKTIFRLWIMKNYYIKIKFSFSYNIYSTIL